MRKDNTTYILLWEIAFITGVVVTVLLLSILEYEDINNLFLLPLFYTISLLIVKPFFYNNKLGVAVGIIEVSSFVRFILLPLAYVLSEELIGYVGIDLRYDYHEKAVILMCYELIAVSLIMLWWYNKHEKKDRAIISEDIVFKPAVIVYCFAIFWIVLVLFVGSFRSRLLNFDVTENALKVAEGTSNNLLTILFEFGKIYIYAIMIYWARSFSSSIGKFIAIVFSSVLFISSSWNDGGDSISRWGLIVSSLLSLFAVLCLFPKKKKLILSSGAILLFVIILISSMAKFMSWGSEDMNINETTTSLMGPGMIDLYFEGVYSVSNGLSTIDMYGNRVGFLNFLTEFLYHFPFAVRVLGVEGHTFAEYYFKLGVGEKSFICPSLIQSCYYFGVIGSPFFSCLSVYLALFFSQKLRRTKDFLIKLLLLYSIFWLSLYNCINFAIVESHIWFAIFGIWICCLGKKRV